MKSFLTYTALFALGLTLTWVVMEIREAVKSPVSAIPFESNEWCLITILDSRGGSIAYGEAGEVTYRVVETARGIEVYQKCSK